MRATSLRVGDCCRPDIDQAATTILLEQVADDLKQQLEALVHRMVHSWKRGEETASPEAIAQLIRGATLFRDLDGHATERTALDPTFQYWLKAARRRRTRETSILNDLAEHLGAIVWAERVGDPAAVGETWSVRADYRGGVRAPSRAAFVELGSEFAHAPVEIRLTVDGALVSVGTSWQSLIPTEALHSGVSGRFDHAYLAVAPRCLGLPISSREPWLNVHFTGTYQREDGVEFFAIDEDWFPKDIDLSPFRDALELLDGVWPEQCEDMKRITRILVPMRSAAGETRAFTVSSRQGAIFIDATDAREMVENIVHENAHVKLRLIQVLDSLLEDPRDDSVRLRVAWRPDPRPIPGILEGVWVFTHVAEWESRRAFCQDQAPGSARLNSMLGHIDDALGHLERHAALTHVGESFLRQMQSWSEDLKVRSLGGRVSR